MAANQVFGEDKECLQNVSYTFKECMTVSWEACGLISKASVFVALNQKNG